MSALNKVNILLVEDNEADYKLLEHRLSEASIKYDLYRSDTLFEAVETATDKPVDIVLLDLSLPDSSGFKTLSKFLSRIPNLPVIVLTGMNNEIVGNQAIKAGAQDFLVKGQFDSKLLGRSIRYSLQRFKSQLKLEEAARNLAISERRFMEAQEMARFGSWEMDIVSNEMTWTNEVFRIFDQAPNSFSPTLSDYINHVHAEDRAQVEQFFEDATKDSQLHQLSHRIVSEQHKVKHIDVQAKVYHEKILNKILLVGAIQDVTERKLSEQLILEKKLSSNTSRFREDALADMGFHIRTPMSSIVNLLFLLDKTPVNSQQKEYLDGLKVSVDDLSIMVNNMLNFSMLTSDKLKIDKSSFKIRDLLKSIKKVFQIKADNIQMNLSFDWSTELPELLVSDAGKITQLFYNIVEYILPETAKTSEDRQLNIDISYSSQQDAAGMLHIAISDKGQWPGTKAVNDLLESDKLLHYLSPDEQPAKDNNQLGLAIALKLIKLLGGQIQITNNDGIQYDIQLPVESVQPKQSDGTNLPDIPVKILLVEDHFLNQIATKKVLTTWSDKISVDIAENGLVAVEKFREHGYDLILMDLQMPVMGGLEAARKILDQAKVPIIALTAHGSNQEEDRCREVGIHDYLTKPFQPHDLYDKILALLVPVSG